MESKDEPVKPSTSSTSETLKNIFTFKFILKILAITGIFLSCFYISISIYFWILASFRGLSLINAIFGGITFLSFIYFYCAIHTTRKLYYYNTFVLFLVMLIVTFLMAVTNLIAIPRISDAALKLFSSQNYFSDIKNDLYVQYFINACFSIFLCCYMIFSMVFVEKARQNATGSNQPDSRNPARPLCKFFFKKYKIRG